MASIPKNNFARLSLVLLVSLAIISPRWVSGQVFLQGDLDKDGDVDIFDYNILLENFGK